jgi:hypothetical protein
MALLQKNGHARPAGRACPKMSVSLPHRSINGQVWERLLDTVVDTGSTGWFSPGRSRSGQHKRAEVSKARTC